MNAVFKRLLTRTIETHTEEHFLRTYNSVGISMKSNTNMRGNPSNECDLSLNNTMEQGNNSHKQNSSAQL